MHQTINNLKFWVLANLHLLMLVCFLTPTTVVSAELEAYSNQVDLDFSLPDIKGKTQSLSDYKGKVVLINFWASWCPPCIYEMPELQKLKKHFAGSPFEIVAINVGEKKYRVRKFAKLIKFDLPVLLDTSSDTFDDWDVKTLPTSFLIDTNGQIRYQVRGAPDWEQEQTLVLIKKLITDAAKPVKPKHDR